MNRRGATGLVGKGPGTAHRAIEIREKRRLAPPAPYIFENLKAIRIGEGQVRFPAGKAARRIKVLDHRVPRHRD